MSNERRNTPKKSAWKQFTPVDSKTPFYFNTATHATSRQCPADNWQKAQFLSGPPNKRKSNLVYYFNPYSHQTSYVKPARFKDPVGDYIEISEKNTKTINNLHTFVPCFDRQRKKCYWYSPDKGRRTWTKPDWCNHPFDPVQEEEELDSDVVKNLRLESDHIKEQYESALDRLEQLKSRMSKLNLKLARKKQRLKNLQASKSAKAQRQFSRQSMNFVSVAIKNAYGKSFLERIKDGDNSSTKAAISFLKSVDLFLYLSEDQFKRLEKNTQELTFKKGEELCQIKSDPTRVLIIQSGIVGVFADKDYAKETMVLSKLVLAMVHDETFNEEDFGQKVNQLYAGDYIGAAEILEKTKFAFSFVSLTDCRVLSVEKDHFSQIINEVNQKKTFLKKNVQDPNEQSAALLHVNSLIANENSMIQN